MVDGMFAGGVGDGGLFHGRAIVDGFVRVIVSAEIRASYAAGLSHGACADQ